MPAWFIQTFFQSLCHGKESNMKWKKIQKNVDCSEETTVNRRFHRF